MEPIVGAYAEADAGAEGDDAEPAEADVGEDAAEDGQEVGDGVPEVEDLGGDSAGHEVPLDEVQDHVGRQPERGHLLEDLVRCMPPRTEPPSGRQTQINPTYTYTKQN